MSETAILRIEVVYALGDRQARYSVSLPAGATVGDAITASGVAQDFPEIDLGRNRVGIFGRLVKPTARLSDADRVEIYRPLVADPKDARRRRVRRR